MRMANEIDDECCVPWSYTVENLDLLLEFVATSSLTAKDHTITASLAEVRHPYATR